MGREGKENGDRPPTIFGLKVALMLTEDARLNNDLDLHQLMSVLT